MSFPIRVPAILASLLLLGVLMAAFPVVLSAQDRVSPAEKRALNRIKSGVERAGKLYTSGKLDRSAEQIEELAAEFEEIVAEGSQALITEAVPYHAMLEEARRVLVEAGASVREIKPLPTPVDMDGALTFSKDIVPILVDNCGRCHVDGQRGQFSMANFNALANGVGGAPVVVPGKPDESRLVEVIEDGAMPPNGEVPAADIAKLKQWIAAGAPYDRDDPTLALRSLAPMNDNAGQGAGQREVEVVMATGDETVSFATDVAPVLIENCIGCHFEAQNVRGGLRVTTFRQLLQGGDGGAIVQAGDSAASNLLQRLTATDNTRMPPGRRGPLDKETIDAIAKWMDEGARFDGHSPNANLREVNAVVTASRADHDTLAAARAERDESRWNKVMSGEPSNSATTANFRAIGTVSEATLARLAGIAEDQVRTIASELGVDASEPLIKGRTTLFVFDRRYDFNEFGKMIEGRDMPRETRVRWDFDTVNAYVVVHLNDGDLGADQPAFLQAIAAVATASRGRTIPRWFADGVGYRIAAELVDDGQVVKEWQELALQYRDAMSGPAAFLRGDVVEEQAGLIGYGFVQSLFANRQSMHQFIEALDGGMEFNDVFVAAFNATPQQLVQPTREDNGRNRRGGRGR